MTQQEFDAQLTHIEDQTAARQERVDGYRDQHLARLFVASEWSQEELAEHLGKRWGKSVIQQWVAQHLRFGRFLAFFTTSGSKESFQIPHNLTERGFRKLWDATEAGGDFRGHKAKTEAAVKDEERRFTLIIEELKKTGLHRKRNQVREAMIKLMAGKDEWLTKEQIAERVSKKLKGPVLLEDIQKCIYRWKLDAWVNYRIEQMGEGSVAKFRIVKGKGVLAEKKQVALLAPDLIPLLDDLIHEAKKDRVEISLSYLCMIAGKIKQILESVNGTVSS